MTIINETRSLKNQSSINQANINQANNDQLKIIKLDQAPDWLTKNLELQFFMRAFKGRVVGGAVRNTLMHLPLKDELDLATPMTPDQMIKVADLLKLKHIPTGIEHGTITILGRRYDERYKNYLEQLLKNIQDTEDNLLHASILDAITYFLAYFLENYEISESLSVNKENESKEVYEFTTLRKDVETDGRHAVVEFTDDWYEDAARRDFTINAMYIDLNGNVYDYFSGAEDVQKRIVRFVGDPSQRIQEDYLRILRFFRFNAHYGLVGLSLSNNDTDCISDSIDISESEKSAHWDKAGVLACKENMQGLRGVSQERYNKEMTKMLQAKDPWEAVKMMEYCDVFKVLNWPAPNWEKIKRYQKYVCELSEESRKIISELVENSNCFESYKYVEISSIGRFAFFDRFNENDSNTDRSADWSAIKMSKKTLKYVNALIKTEISSQTDWFSALYKYGAEWVKDKIFLENEQDLKFVEVYKKAEIPLKLPINGDDIMSFNMKRKVCSVKNANDLVQSAVDSVEKISDSIISGPIVGEVYNEILEYWISTGFKANREDCLIKLKDILAEKTLYK